MPNEGAPALMRFDGVVPVVAGSEQMHPLRQHQDVVVADVRRPGLDKAHRHVRILGQPGCQCAAGGAAAGYHIIECGANHHACSTASDSVVAAWDSRQPIWWRPLTKYHSRPEPRI